VRLLVAEDDAFFRRMLVQVLSPEYDLEIVNDGDAAWRALQAEGSPQIAVLDWVMPGLSGPQICRRVRAHARVAGIYLILLTAKNSIADVVSGLRAGADDYVTKPFDPEELRARLRVGQRVMRLQFAVDKQVQELQAALAREQTLRQLLPVCPQCRSPKVDGEYQRRLEQYLAEHKALGRQDWCPGCNRQLAPADPGIAAEVHP